MLSCLRLLALVGFVADPPAVAPVAPPPADSTAAAAVPAEAHPDTAPDTKAEVAAGDDALSDEGEQEAGEGEGPGPAVPDEGAPRHTSDLSDAELELRWVDDLPSLGSISVGFAEAGRLINGVKMPPGDAWELLTPELAWGTQETLDAIELVARSVRERFPEAIPLRVNHISKRDGGWLRPHKTHQSGRDVDLGFYERTGAALTAAGGKAFDPLPNWALVRALVTQTDLAVILVDRRVSAAIYAAALAAGEDRGWLDSIFHGASPLVQHARGHRDHFHVRFFAPRAQELGRRVQPLLARRPDENRIVVRVRGGDTLGHLAARYGSTVALIQNANGMRSSFLRAGQSLCVPLRGPCTRCPLPPPVVLPPRRLPPAVAGGAVDVTAEAGVATTDADTPSATTAAAVPPVSARDPRSAPVP